MAAYAALVSLMQIFDQIENHPTPPISLDKKQVETLTETVIFLQEFLEGYKSPFADEDEADPLEMRIADAVYAAEDVIESYIVDQILPAAPKETVDQIIPAASEDEMKWIGSNYGQKTTFANFYESLTKVIEDMDLIKKEVMEIIQLQSVGSSTSSKMMLRNNSLTSSLPKLSSTTMVGFDDIMLQLMDKLTNGAPGRQVIPITGMGGIGKTTLAINVYAKPLITHHFDICAWVTISQQYNSKELLCEILSQADKEEKGQSSNLSEDKIGLKLHKCLSYKRYLIVLDDMWSIETWEEIQCYFPEYGNGSRIMVTTRLSNLGSQLDSNYALEMKFMDNESSWNMFCKIVFGEGSCPFELENIGKTIVEGCRGLPLSIVVMGGLLEKLEPTIHCWVSVRRSITSLVNLENDKHCLKMLKLSYNHLPVYLKPCFLYMGMYEEDRKIRVSTVIKLWVSEGFLKPIRGKSLETVAKEYLVELVDRNLIHVHDFGKTGNMKYLKMHDLLRDLCLREAENERFYHVVGHSPQDTCSQRRVVIPKSTSQEEILDPMEYTVHTRSYISQHKRVQVLPNLRLLRTLLAHDRWRSPPQNYSLRKISKLVNLRLLDVHSTWYAQLPSSINLLWSLQTLIVSHFEAKQIAPFEIWNMPQLRHVNLWTLYGRSHLLNPPSDSIVIMENLQTLVGVKNFKCDEMMVRRIPNIKKLGLSYMGTESRGEDYCVNNIERLQKLESLTCYGFTRGEFLRKLTFPHSLKSLTITMIDGRMEDMLEKISALPLLQKLKLSYGYFTTGKWETVEGQFLSLKYLSLEHLDQLECWMMESSHFPCLEHIHLKWMYCLEEIPIDIGEIPTLKSVVLEYCNESVVESAKRMVEEQEELQGEEQLSFKVEVWLTKENKELQSLANPNFQVI
ncbi:putative late blight resistance protein homolog R1A-10 [Salvia hispanica]|uniref:putative late blight resistance protein homolog R1A-10 n=1 Tax=Salvia hispanica TaxID=49212 RepID=UPI002008F50C|nr:putative late blight resistance protein homolog R1A-10 [Salvia hispanica]